MKRKQISAVIIATALIVIVVLSVFVVFIGSIAPESQPFTPHYLTYQGTASKIYLASATTSYTTARQNYSTPYGQQVPEGTQLFTINLTIRNDYSSDNPPPSLSGIPAAPIDGTAYVCLNFTAYNKQGAVPTVNVTPSDFTPAQSAQTGLVLASAQTLNTNIILATNNTEINAFTVDLVSVSDSITG